MIILSCLSLTAPAVLATPTLSSSTTLSTAGFFQLSWTNADTSAPLFELQQASTKNFNQARTLYQGPDQATTISGLADQRYFYRVRLIGQKDWSKTIAVTVKHHPLSRAFGFFTLGLVMFLITLFVLIKGIRNRLL